MAFKTLPQYPESADFRAGAIAACKAIREIPELVGSDDLDQVMPPLPRRREEPESFAGLGVAPNEEANGK
jgi:hypothetical protein